MQNRFFSALCFIFFIIAKTDAQKITGCGFKVPPKSFLKANFQSVYDAQTILKTILDSINWKENFRVREQNGIQNVYATSINKVRWIVYDNNFLEDIDAYTTTKWASVSVLAHEMGHHYYNHVVSGNGSTASREIEADAFSGYVMEKLGATLQQSVAAMQAIASDKASSTLPGKKDRMDAVTRGWNTARENTSNTIPVNPNNPSSPDSPGPFATNSTKPGVPYSRNQNNTDFQKDPGWIGLTIQSNRDEVVLLSDNGREFQKAIIKAGQVFVFKFEIYNYGWLKLKYYNGYRIYKLMHGKDYSILWNRRTGNWGVVEVPQ